MKEITHIDLFSGPGGICTGFRAAGIKTLLSVEKVQSCVETYSANHPDVKVLNMDVRKVNKSHISNLIDITKGVDIVSSGMPCETFSTAGATSRSSYDHRQQLYSEAIRIAHLCKARIILFENVPGILSKKVEKGGSRLIIDDIFDELSENGYKYQLTTVLNSSDFGVPQKRNRYFIIATNEESLRSRLKVPVAKHNGTITVKDAFRGLPPVEANSKASPSKYRRTKENGYTELIKNNEFWRLGSNNKDLSYHTPPNHRPKSLERFSLIEQGEGLKDLFFKYSEEKVKSLQEQGILPKKWYIQRNRRLRLDKPSMTITSHCLDEVLHPLENRALTVREAARLQSFPDGYDFAGGPWVCPHMDERQDKYEQIGDAVPPLLAYHWGLVILEILD